MGNLPRELLCDVASRLPCVADRDDAADVCREWRAALETSPSPKLPRQLPWLLLPSANSTLACCLVCGTGCAIGHKLKGMDGARYFGSYKGGWLFLAYDQFCSHAVVNVRAPHPERTVLNLPNQVVCRQRQDCHDIVILAATLSSQPDDKICIGAGITLQWRFVVGQRQMAFWMMGCLSAISLEDDGTGEGDQCDPLLEPEDVLYHEGAFRFLTNGGHIRICTPLLTEGGDLERIAHSVSFFNDVLVEMNGYPVIGRYLLSSRESLLMVVRFGIQSELKTGFRVYRAVHNLVSDDGATNASSWCELHTLDNRILYVGRGCSRSYEIEKLGHEGLEEGIYFSEDGFFNPTVMFFGANDRKYPCIDNGLWTEFGTTNVQRCFPMQDPSKKSPPVWLLP
ncbi:hypothetical protein BS78_01G196100 [Paspalum vaginatum]|nr:hypothetical protein BS78_01G196100 [Paspalum vaginatum]